MKIVIITTSAKALFGLRKELVESWVKAGHEVIAIGELNCIDFSEKCNNAGFKYRHATLSRNGLNPIVDFKSLKELSAILNELQPDRVLCTFAKAIAYGCWAARRAKIDKTFALISGLGTPFRNNTFKQRIVRVFLSFLYKNAFKGCNTVIFQNNDDRMELVKRGLLTSDKTAIVNGSGVDTNRYAVHPLPNNKTVLFIGRLLKDKGIREFIEAAVIVKSVIPDSTFMVVGDTDSNPTSLTKEEVVYYQNLGIIEFYGFKDDVRPFIRQADIFVLPSYHEGTPRCVLEAMSMGRPIITTNAPGCRETVIDGLNGYLIPVGKSDILANKIESLLLSPTVQQSMGKQSRLIAEKKYDVIKVNLEYNRIMQLH